MSSFSQVQVYFIQQVQTLLSDDSRLKSPWTTRDIAAENGKLYDRGGSPDFLCRSFGTGTSGSVPCGLNVLGGCFRAAWFNVSSRFPLTNPTQHYSLTPHNNSGGSLARVTSGHFTQRTLTATLPTVVLVHRHGHRRGHHRGRRRGS